MLDHETVGERLDRMEQAQAQNFELVMLRFERVEGDLEHMQKTLDMIVNRLEWISKALTRRMERIGSE